MTEEELLALEQELAAANQQPSEADLLAQLEGPGTSQLDLLPINSINATTRAITGAQFGGTSQAINNLRAMARKSGQRPLDEALAERDAEIKAQEKAEKDAIDLEFKLAKEQRDRDKAARDAALNEARITKLGADTDASKAKASGLSSRGLSSRGGSGGGRSSGGSSAGAVSSTGEFGKRGGELLDGYLNRLTKKQNPGVTANKSSTFWRKSFDRFAKRKESELAITTRAQNVVDLISRFDGSFETASKKELLALEKSSSGAIKNMLARASGEVGALTEADKAAFGGDQSLRGKISRWTKGMATGKMTTDDKVGLKLLAKVFLEGSRNRLKSTAKDAIINFKRVGAVDNDLLDLNVLRDLGGFSAEDIGLADTREPKEGEAAPEQSAAPAPQAVPQQPASSNESVSDDEINSILDGL